jgi:hypothetical protein
MSTIFRDKVTIDNGVDRFVANDPSDFNPMPYRVKCDLLDGWRNTANLDAVIVPRGISDGATFGQRFPAKERYLLMGGYFVGETREDADNAEDEIVRRLPLNVDMQMTRHEPTPKTTTVRVYDSIEFSREPFETAFRFVVPLVAGDPNKYGLEPLSGETGVSIPAQFGRSYPRTYPLQYSSTSGGVDSFADVYVGGTTTTKKIVSTVSGPLVRGAWRIINRVNGEERSLSFNVGLFAGQSLVIDHKNHEALLNGFPVQIGMEGEWWGMEPGLNRVSLVTGDFNEEARLNIQAYSAWR